MNREYLFRGIDINSGEWGYWYYIKRVCDWSGEFKYKESDI